MERLCIASFPILVKQIAAFQYWCNPRVSAYAIHCVAIQNKRPAPTNAVFFPSAQMKNVRYKPNYPTETRTIPSRTQSTQTSRRSGDYRQHLNCTNYIVPNHAVSGNVPAAAVFPGKRLRGVGEIGRDSQIRTISLTAPARREAVAPSQLTIRIPDKRPKKPEAAAPIPVQKQDIGHTSDTIPAPGRCINRNDLYGFISWRAMAERQKKGA